MSRETPWRSKESAVIRDRKSVRMTRRFVRYKSDKRAKRLTIKWNKDFWERKKRKNKNCEWKMNWNRRQIEKYKTENTREKTENTIEYKEDSDKGTSWNDLRHRCVGEFVVMKKRPNNRCRKQIEMRKDEFVFSLLWWLLTGNSVVVAVIVV